MSLVPLVGSACDISMHEQRQQQADSQPLSLPCIATAPSASLQSTTQPRHLPSVTGIHWTLQLHTMREGWNCSRLSAIIATSPAALAAGRRPATMLLLAAFSPHANASCNESRVQRNSAKLPPYSSQGSRAEARAEASDASSQCYFPYSTSSSI